MIRMHESHAITVSCITLLIEVVCLYGREGRKSLTVRKSFQEARKFSLRVRRSE